MILRSVFLSALFFQLSLSSLAQEVPATLDCVSTVPASSKERAVTVEEDANIFQFANIKEGLLNFENKTQLTWSYDSRRKRMDYAIYDLSKKMRVTTGSVIATSIDESNGLVRKDPVLFVAPDQSLVIFQTLKDRFHVLNLASGKPSSRKVDSPILEVRLEEGTVVIELENGLELWPNF